MLLTRESREFTRMSPTDIAKVHSQTFCPTSDNF
jgi:hypothetical protein